MVDDDNLLTYDDITNDLVSSRVLYLCELFDNELVKPLVAEFPHYKDSVLLSESVLVQVVWSYFYDVVRYKDFHYRESESQPIHRKIDGRKQAAFMVKWLLQLRPVNSNPSGSKTLLTYWGNEDFAFTVGTCFAAIDQDFINKSLEPLYPDIVYYYKYRQATEGSLMLWFETLQKIADGK